MKRLLAVGCVLILGAMCVAYAAGKAGGPPPPPEGKSMKMPREEVKGRMQEYESKEWRKPEMWEKCREMMEHHPMPPVPMYMRRGEWQNMAVNFIGRIVREADRLGLKRGQVAELKEVMRELRKRNIMAQARMEVLKIDLEAIMENGGPFEKMRDIVNQIVDVNKELAMAQIDALQHTRDIVGKVRGKNICCIDEGCNIK